MSRDHSNVSRDHSYASIGHFIYHVIIQNVLRDHSNESPDHSYHVFILMHYMIVYMCARTELSHIMLISSCHKSYVQARAEKIYN